MLEIFVPFLWVAFHYHRAHKPAPEKDSASTETVSEEQAENRVSLKIANCRPFVIPSCYIGDRGMILRNSLVEDRIKFEIERITSMLIILIHMDLAFDGYGFTNIWSVLIILIFNHMSLNTWSVLWMKGFLKTPNDLFSTQRNSFRPFSHSFLRNLSQAGWLVPEASFWEIIWSKRELIFKSQKVHDVKICVENWATFCQHFLNEVVTYDHL